MPPAEGASQIDPIEPLPAGLRMAGVGHEGQFAPPRLSGRSAFSEETFAGRCGNEKDAPSPAFARLPSNCRSRPELAFADRKTSAARDPTRKRPSAFDVPGGHLPRILTVWMVGEVGW